VTTKLNAKRLQTLHRARHIALHRYLDELCADWAAQQPCGKVFSNSTIMELMQWSHQQTIRPTEPEQGR
jgi:hypothetical protein